MAQFAVGTVLAERYRLDAPLGQGGMGAVWRAHHLTLNTAIALKFIDPALAEGEEMRQRFTREAQAAAALQGCPNVVQMIDHGLHQGVPYIAMELMQGETLGERLASVKVLQPAELAEILSQAGRGVRKAHENGIVHRDLKPDNIFLVHEEEVPLVKVLDFGIAKMSSAASVGVAQTRTGALMGTPYYMSPEQAVGNRAVDFDTDIWALGVIACECLTGRRPFDAEAVGALVLQICSKKLPLPSQLGAVPAGFDAWFARACCRDKAGRFASVREQMQALRQVCDVHGPSAPPLNPTLESSAPVLAAATVALALEEPAALRPQALGLETGAPVASTGFNSSPEAGAGAKRNKLLGAAAVGLLLSGGGYLGWGGSSSTAPQSPPLAGAAARGSPPAKEPQPALSAEESKQKPAQAVSVTSAMQQPDAPPITAASAAPSASAAPPAKALSSRKAAGSPASKGKKPAEKARHALSVGAQTRAPRKSSAPRKPSLAKPAAKKPTDYGF